MKKDLKKTTTDEKDKKGFDLIGLIFKFFKGSLFPAELGDINRCLVKANEISPSPYFMRLLTKNRFIWFVASLPSLINLFLLFMYFKGQNTITREIIMAWNLGKKAVLAKNPDLLTEISFSENFLVYLVAISAQIVAMTALSWIFMAIIKRVNPVIRESRELKEYCLSKNYSTDQDHFFLVCKAGILARISSSSGDDLIKDKNLWRHLDKIPKDPIESTKDRSIVFIGNGFRLQRYEFKIV